MQAALDAAVGAGRSTVTATSSTTFEIRFIGPFSQIVHFSYNSAYNFEVLDDAIRITFPDDGPPSNQFTFNLNFRGRAMVRWMEVDAATNQIKQAGNISSPSLSFYYPSLAVNEAGDVVIGFSGSGSTQFPSAYYVIGHKVDGYTTFTKPRLLQAGSGNYDGRWGDYSATVLDPSDPTLFWTFQEYTVADDKWGVKIAAIRATGPGSHDYGQSHNLLLPVDVTADGDVAADDVVSIINFIAAYGAVEVEPNSLGTPYCDVDGDGWITATDVVMVINYINAHPLSLADLI
jgi:hypothetical protein